MINLEDCIELGRLTRTHGIKGQITLRLNSFSFEEIENMEWVYIMVDGLPVPFFVEEFSEKNADTLIIKLEDVDSEPEAKKYSDTQVFIDRNIVQSTHEDLFNNPDLLKGYAVIDKNKGFIGQLDALVEYGENPVVRVLHERTEILIPFQDEFFVAIDNENKAIRVECPDGLLDLYLNDEPEL